MVTNTEIREYLKMLKAYDILCVGKKILARKCTKSNGQRVHPLAVLLFFTVEQTEAIRCRHLRLTICKHSRQLCSPERKP